MSTYRNRLLVERKDRRRPAMRKKGDKNTPSDFGPYVDSLDGNVYFLFMSFFEYDCDMVMVGLLR